MQIDNARQLLWELDDILAAISGSYYGSKILGVNSINIDSRDVSPDSCFIALRGDKFNGHDFIEPALAAGAKLLILERQYIKADIIEQLTRNYAAGILLVEDSLKALWQLAAAARARSRAKIIAITGSVGKTSTKHFLANLLAEYGKIYAAPASFNNHIGVPLTLARLPLNTDFAVLELGMSAKGEIAMLSELAKPDIAIITKIAPAHLAFFNNLQEIALAKAEIFPFMAEQSQILLNLDDPLYSLLQAEAESAHISDIRSFGSTKQANYQFSDIELISGLSNDNVNLSNDNLKFVYKHMKDGIVVETATVTMPHLPMHMLYNVVASLGVIDILTGDLRLAVNKLKNINLLAGRGAKLTLKINDDIKVEIYDESYNANPTSMQAALDFLTSLNTQQGAKKVAVIGDMLELGNKSKLYHEALEDLIHKADITSLFLVGKDIKFLFDKLQASNITLAPSNIKLHYASDYNFLYDKLVNELTNGDIVFVKASNGIGLGDLVKRLQKEFVI